MFNKKKTEKEPEVIVTRPVSFTVYNAQISASFADSTGNVCTLITVSEPHAREIITALSAALNGDA